jgi:dihydrofolate reductase
VNAGAPDASAAGDDADATIATVELAIVAAVAANGVIGDADRLPWRLPADLRRFRELTTGHTVIMGRRTWASLGRALPDRQNIVVTRQPGFDARGAEVAHSLRDALARARRPDPVFCIGGGEIYRAALPHAATLYLTEIARDVAGDTTFPAFDRRAWREVAREPHSENGFAYAFVTYRRPR